MILIEPDAHVPRAALPKRELSRFLDQACERLGVCGEVTILITTDARMQDLNRSFRRKNKPTDVLSFPPAPVEFAGQAAHGGDLAISFDIARRQAKSLGHALSVEVEILILHGLLHLSGMDHEQDTGQMGRREAKLRREFGLPTGLIQRSKSAFATGRAFKNPTSQRQDPGHTGRAKNVRKGKVSARTSQKTVAKPGRAAKIKSSPPSSTTRASAAAAR